MKALLFKIMQSSVFWNCWGGETQNLKRKNEITKAVKIMKAQNQYDRKQGWTKAFDTG